MSEFLDAPNLRKGSIERREYQVALANSVISNGNTLIVAPTALGKTIIAAMVIAKRMGNGKILFLAPTKPLAQQHQGSLREVIDIGEDKVMLLTGETNPEERKGIFEKARIICATPQTIRNDADNHAISLKGVSLVIFDEAHRAVKDYAYTSIARKYFEQADDPLVLALTASPGGSKAKINEVKGNLGIKNIEIRTEDDPDVKPYIHKKEITWKKTDLPQELSNVSRLFDAYAREKVSDLNSSGLRVRQGPSKKELLVLQNSMMRQKEGNPAAYHYISVIASLIKVSHANELCQTQGVSQTLNFLRKLRAEKTRASKTILNHPAIQQAIVELTELFKSGFEHPKIGMVLNEANASVSRNESMIIFAHYRETAQYIKDMLASKGIAAEKFIGQATRNEDKGYSQKEQKEIIRRFREKEFPVIIMTSIGEEGLDIPSVDHVIFYEPVPSEIRLIQRRGRTGRKHDGRVTVLMTSKTYDEAYYWSSRSKEEKMYKILHKMSDKVEIRKDTQLTMDRYVDMDKPKETTVFVDSRESPSGIVRELVNEGIRVKQHSLKVGDYIISDRIVIERKTAADFIQSMIDGRLFEQAEAMKQNFGVSILLVEGDLFEHDRNIHDNALRGALLSLSLKHNVFVFQTRSIADTAKFIAALAKKEQSGDNVPKLRGEKPKMGDRQWMEYIVSSLPNVGPKAAKGLLRHFGSVGNVFKASEMELRGAEGMGPLKAKKIRQLLSSDYGS